MSRLEALRSFTFAWLLFRLLLKLPRGGLDILLVHRSEGEDGAGELLMGS